MKITDSIQHKLEVITARWWFFALFILTQMLPPYTSKAFDPANIQSLISAILSDAYINHVGWIRHAFPIFQLLAIGMFVGVLVLRGRWWGVFSVYCALIFLWFAAIQFVGVIPNYGFSILTSGVLLFVLVALTWLLEAASKKTKVELMKWRPGTIVAAAAALVTFWYPVHRETGMPEFNPVHLFTSPSGSAFCLFTPAALILLIACYPHVNLVTLRVTALTGLIIGAFNMLSNFGAGIEHNWWNGVLHIPLLTISLYGIVLGYRQRKVATLVYGIII